MHRIDAPVLSDAPPPQLLEVRVEPDRQWAVLRLTGELELTTAARLTSAVQELLDVGFDAIRIDLRGVTFIDSTGLRALLKRAGRDPRVATFELVPGPPAVQRVFELCGVEDLLPLTARPTA